MSKLLLSLCCAALLLSAAGCDRHEYCENTRLYIVRNESKDTVYYSLKGFDDEGFVRVSPGFSRNILPIYVSESNDGPDIDIQVSDIIGSFDYIQVVCFRIGGRRFIDAKSNEGSMINPDSYMELRGADIERYVDKPLQRKYTQYYLFVIDDEYIGGLREVE